MRTWIGLCLALFCLAGCTTIKREYNITMLCTGESDCEIDTELLLEQLDTETSPTNTPDLELSPTLDLHP